MLMTLSHAILGTFFTVLLLMVAIGLLAGVFPRLKWMWYPRIVQNQAICCNWQLPNSFVGVVVRLVLWTATAGVLSYMGATLISAALLIYTVMIIGAWFIREEMVAMGMRQHKLTYIDFKKGN
jgi:hypothetical protein